MIGLMAPQRLLGCLLLVWAGGCASKGFPEGWPQGGEEQEMLVGMPASPVVDARPAPPSDGASNIGATASDAQAAGDSQVTMGDAQRAGDSQATMDDGHGTGDSQATVDAHAGDGQVTVEEAGPDATVPSECDAGALFAWVRVETELEAFDQSTDAMAVADLDGDGQSELALADREGRVEILGWSAALGWSVVQRATLGGPIGHLLWDDVTGDGVADLLGTGAVDPKLWMARGTPSGTFDAFETIDTPALITAIARIRGAESSRPGLVIGASDPLDSAAPTTIWIAADLAMPDFVPLAFDVELEAFGPLLVADLDSDGLQDVLTGTQWLRNQGDGRFTGRHIPVQQRVLATGLAVEDFDRDGSPEIAIVEGYLVQVFRRDPEGIFQQWWQGGQIYGTAVVTGRANCDGRPDLIALSGHGLDLFLASPEGLAEEPITARGVDPIGGMLAGDFDGDGRVDIVHPMRRDCGTQRCGNTLVAFFSSFAQP